MKTKGLAALALLTLALGFTAGGASASLLDPSTARELGAPPPPMPITGTIGQELGAPPPPMPFGRTAVNELGAPPPPMPIGPASVNELGAPPPPMPVR
jgi:hypothetical protein